MLFQRNTVDKAYYIAKELLMTERTYRKDLEVITVVSVHLFRFEIYLCYEKLCILSMNWESYHILVITFMVVQQCPWIEAEV